MDRGGRGREAEHLILRGLFARKRGGRADKAKLKAEAKKSSKAKRKRKLAKPKTIRTKVVGVTFKNEDGTQRQQIVSRHKRGDTLRLKHQPIEGHPNAVAVYGRKNQQLGHLRSELAKEMVEYMKAGRKITCRVLEVTGGGPGRSWGCNIEITIR